MDINPEFKQTLLETIQAIEDQNRQSPVVFKWKFDEKQDWTIALGFKKEVVQ